MTGERLTAGRALAMLREWREATAFSPATIALEQSSLARLLPRFGKALARIRRPDVEALLAARAGEVRPASVARELTALRALFRLLAEAGLVPGDPTDGLSVAVPRSAPVALSEAAVQRLIAEASRPVWWARRSATVADALALRNRAVLELLYGLGLRASEVCQARVVDLQLADASLLVRRAKRGKPARLPLPQAAVPHLRAYLTSARSVLVCRGDRCDGRLLATETGRRLTVGQLQRILNRIAERAGVVGVHPHALRRALATHLVKRGAPVTAVQYLLGHKSVGTTQRYLGLCLDDLRAAVETLDLEGTDGPRR